jgi:hypothetical protein
MDPREAWVSAAAPEGLEILEDRIRYPEGELLPPWTPWPSPPGREGGAMRQRRGDGRIPHRPGGGGSAAGGPPAGDGGGPGGGGPGGPFRDAPSAPGPLRAGGGRGRRPAGPVRLALRGAGPPFGLGRLDGGRGGFCPRGIFRLPPSAAGSWRRGRHEARIRGDRLRLRPLRAAGPDAGGRLRRAPAGGPGPGAAEEVLAAALAGQPAARTVAVEPGGAVTASVVLSAPTLLGWLGLPAVVPLRAEAGGRLEWWDAP